MEIDDGLGLQPSAPPEHDFTVSALDLVTRTFKLWFRKLPSYILIVGLLGVAFNLLHLAVFYALYGSLAFDLLAYVGPDIITTLLRFATSETVIGIEFIILAIVLTVVGMVVNAVIAGGGIKFALDDYGFHQADVETSLSFAFSRLSTMIVVQFLLASIVTVALAPSTFIMADALATYDLNRMMTGFFFYSIGAIVALYFVIRLSPTSAVVVAEDLGAIDSMKRAWKLTTGNFWHIFGGQILLGIALFVIGLVLGTLVSLAFYDVTLVLYISAFIILLLFGAIAYVFSVVLYRDLESRSRVVSQEYW
jgi:hypothetical protein